MIDTLTVEADPLVVRWFDGVVADYPCLWVRDHWGAITARGICWA